MSVFGRVQADPRARLRIPMRGYEVALVDDAKKMQECYESP